MAFDGITVSCLRKELSDKLTGGRITKIVQSEADELLLTIKNNANQYRLLLSASASLPLAYLTDKNKPAPMTAPGFCMLLRKRLTGGRLIELRREPGDRIVYFDAKTKVHIENYLSTRMDSSEALFVSSKAPHERLQIGGVEALLRKLGRELDLGRVHPHKFRRTLATKAIDKGMPIEQVQVLLGHKKIDTTLRYAMVDQRNVKASHRRYLT